MGVNFSKPSESNSTSTATATATAAANSSPTIPKPETESTHSPESPESETPIQENQGENETQLEEVLEDLIKEEDGGDDGEEEEGECGFCLFMKGGGCKDTFTEWEKCVDEGEKNKENIVEKCFEATSALKKCMEAHNDYYAPVLQAEKAAEEQVVKQFQHEKNGEESGKKKEKDEALDASEKKKAS